MLENFERLKDLTSELKTTLASLDSFEVKAVVFANRLRLRSLHPKNTPSDPIFFNIPPAGVAVAFHFGVVVFFNVADDMQKTFLDYLKSYADKVMPVRLSEVMPIAVNPKSAEEIRKNTISIKAVSRQHMDVIADVMAKSIVLDHFESTVVGSFSQVEPVAMSLRNKGRLTQTSVELLKQIGGSLLTEHEMVGKIELSEKPIVLWHHTELEGLYHKLIDEFEILERQTILDRKIELIARTAQTSLDVLQHRHASRLEWYIIILILVSIIIELYAVIFLPH